MIRIFCIGLLLCMMSGLPAPAIAQGQDICVQKRHGLAMIPGEGNRPARPVFSEELYDQCFDCRATPRQRIDACSNLLSNIPSSSKGYVPNVMASRGAAKLGLADWAGALRDFRAANDYDPDEYYRQLMERATYQINIAAERKREETAENERLQAQARRQSDFDQQVKERARKEFLSALDGCRAGHVAWCHEAISLGREKSETAEAERLYAAALPLGLPILAPLAGIPTSTLLVSALAAALALVIGLMFRRQGADGAFQVERNKEPGRRLGNTNIVNYVMMGVGTVGLVGVYSLRPPTGFGDALMKAAQGQEFFLKEPVYYLGLIMFGLLLVFGVVRVLRTERS